MGLRYMTGDLLQCTVWSATISRAWPACCSMNSCSLASEARRQ